MGWIIGLLAAVLLVAIGWVVVRGAGALSELQNLRNSVAQLQSAVADRSSERVERIAPRIEQHAALARELTSDPVWRGFELLPWVGGNLTAVREVAEIADDTAAAALDPIVGIAPDAELATLGLSGGRIDLAKLRGLAEPLSSSAAALSSADTRARQIDVDVSIGPIADAVTGARGLIRTAAATVGGLHGASVLLPSMLGGDGPRNYLIAVQDNSEIRSQGGAIAAFVVVRVDDGAVRIGRTVRASDLPPLKKPLPLDDAVLALYGDGPARVANEATSAPDFATAGELLVQYWKQRFDASVAGVIAVDIETMRYVLAPTDGISFGGFAAASGSIASTLAVDVPSTVSDPAERQTLFAEAARTTLDALLSSPEPDEVMAAFAAAATADRIRVWSAAPDEQEFLEKTSLAGALPTDGDGEVAVGVLLDDRTHAPLGPYVDTTISTAIGMCAGAPTTQVSVTWTNAVPDEVAAAATAPADGAPGDVRTLIAIYGPQGASAGDESTTALADRPVVQHDVTVAPGESRTVTATFTGPGAGHEPTRVHHTPMLEDPEIVHVDLDCG